MTGASSAMNQSKLKQLTVTFSKGGKNQAHKVRLVLVLLLID